MDRNEMQKKPEELQRKCSSDIYGSSTKKGHGAEKAGGRILAFLLILVLLLGIPGVFLTPQAIRKQGITASGLKCCAGLMKEQKNSIDVLVIGDSESYTSVSPMVLWKEYGMTSYDAGKAGAKISETEETLEEAMKTQNPRVVLMETNNLFRYNTGGNPKESALSEGIYHIFPALKYHNIWKNLFWNFGNGTFKGFQLNSAVKPFQGEIFGKVVTGDRVTDDTLSYLDRIQAICEKKGSTLVLYSAPSPKCYTREKTKALTKIAKTRGLTYLNLNACKKKMGIDWAVDTRDHGDHMNTSGGLKTTEYLGQYLKANYEIPDRSGSSIAAAWNSEYQRYQPAEEHTMEIIARKAGQYPDNLEAMAQKEEKNENHSVTPENRMPGGSEKIERVRYVSEHH